jgi:Putative phage serine protease XkdF
MSRLARITKTAEPERRMIWAEVYAPNRPDVDGEYMTEEDIRTMAYRFVVQKMSDQVDTQHNNKVQKGVRVFESFIARPGDPDFIPGSWVVGVHVDDDELWAKVKSGELNSFSVEALVTKQMDDVVLDIPDVVTGLTSEHSGHKHTFEVKYDGAGKFIGGQTSVSAGHSHTIRAGTITDQSQGHRHKFSSVDGITLVTE